MSRNFQTHEWTFPFEFQSNPGKVTSMTINGTSFAACFGDIFVPSATNGAVPGGETNGYQPDRHRWVPMIPNYPDGVLYKQLISMNRAKVREYNPFTYGPGAVFANDVGNPEAIAKRAQEPPIQVYGDWSKRYGVILVHTALEHIPVVILFSYADVLTDRWFKIFEDCGKVLAENDFLVCPAIGTNNNISFWLSAITIFHAVRSALQKEDSTAHKVASICVMAPYGNDGEMTSARVIRHLQQQMSMREETCRVCHELPIDTVLSCGHRLLCATCAENIFMAQRCCPLCRKRIYDTSAMSVCVRVVDYTGPEYQNGGGAGGATPEAGQHEVGQGSSTETASTSSSQGPTSDNTSTFSSENSEAFSMVSQSTPYKCCSVNGPKLRKICVPCGCFRGCCQNCYRAIPRFLPEGHPEAGMAAAQASEVAQDVCDVNGEPFPMGQGKCPACRKKAKACWDFYPL